MDSRARFLRSPYLLAPIVLLLTAVLLTASTTDLPTATARFDPPAPKPGARAMLVFELEEPLGTETFQLGMPPDQAGILLVQEAGRVEGETASISVRILRTDVDEIGPFTLSVGNEVMATAPAMALQDIERLPPPAELLDYTEPVAAPINWVRMSLFAAGALVLLTALAAALVFLVRKIARRRAAAAALANVPPPVPPITEAKEAIAALSDLALYRSKGCKAHYSALSEALRRYLEREFDAPVLEMTEDEAIEFARARFAEAAGETLRPVFLNSSVAKFARWEGSEEQAAEDVERALRFLRVEEDRIAVEEMRKQQNETRPTSGKGEAA